MKYIINADDFGLTESCTKAIMDAFQRKLITDTTMVANGEAFDLALQYSQSDHLHQRIGIHFNLTEGSPLTEGIKKYSLFVTNGSFHGKINRIKPLTKEEKTAVYEELSAQIQKIESAGIPITHADSHHHIHTAVFIAPIVLRVCREHGITKTRLHRNIGIISKPKRVIKKLINLWLQKNGFKTCQYFGSVEDLRVSVPDGLIEIMVHPDYSKECELVDRIQTEEGYAIGEPLVDLEKLAQSDYSSYSEL